MAKYSTTKILPGQTLNQLGLFHNERSDDFFGEVELTGNALKFIRVNAAETDVEMVGILGVVNITGNWDMVANAQIIVAHGLNAGQISRIFGYQVAIIENGGTVPEPLMMYGTGPIDGRIVGGINAMDATNITLGRLGGDIFDNANYNNATYKVAFLLMPA